MNATLMCRTRATTAFHKCSYFILHSMLCVWGAGCGWGRGSESCHPCPFKSGLKGNNVLPREETIFRPEKSLFQMISVHKKAKGSRCVVLIHLKLELKSFRFVHSRQFKVCVVHEPSSKWNAYPVCTWFSVGIYCNVTWCGRNNFIVRCPIFSQCRTYTSNHVPENVCVLQECNWKLEQFLRQLIIKITKVAKTSM